MHFPMASLPQTQFAPPQQVAPQQFTYPGTAYQPAPQRPQASPLTPKFAEQTTQQPVLAAQAGGSPPKAPQPQPIIRMQGPDPEAAAPPARLVMPSPEELGLALPVGPAPTTKEIDLNSAYTRLRQLGAIGLHLDRLTQGGYRATFVLSASEGPRQVNADGATEGAALAAALERAEAFVVRK